MSITWDDIARDMALEDLHHEAVMKRATREQCIFLFVEGECEANTIPGFCSMTLSSSLWGFKLPTTTAVAIFR
jgi:hypothetical protein